MTREANIADNKDWKGKIACQYVHSNIRLDTSQMKTSVNSYVYALFEKGTSRIRYDKHDIETQPGDFIIFPPHIPPRMLSTSEDYEAICLIVSSNFIFDSPMVRNVFQAATFPQLHSTNPIMKLPVDWHSTIREIMLLIMRHIQSEGIFTTQALQSLYSLVLADIIPLMENQDATNYTNKRSNDLFIEFNKLLRENFREHHDINFYADRLNISTRYLSMITKQIANTTVATFINRHLMLEACWLLKTTDMSIQQVSDALHFSDQASFSKFFKRINGMPPLQYRREQEPNT